MLHTTRHRPSFIERWGMPLALAIIVPGTLLLFCFIRMPKRLPVQIFVMGDQTACLYFPPSTADIVPQASITLTCPQAGNRLLHYRIVSTHNEPSNLVAQAVAVGEEPDGGTTTDTNLTAYLAHGRISLGRLILESMGLPAWLRP